MSLFPSSLFPAVSCPSRRRSRTSVWAALAKRLPSLLLQPLLRFPRFITRSSLVDWLHKMHALVVSRPAQHPYSISGNPSPSELKTGRHHYATSTSSFDSESTLCASPDTFYSFPWSDKSQRRSTSSSRSTLGEAAAPEQRLHKFASRQCALLQEMHPTCHIVALPRGARPRSLQVIGCRDQEGERREEDGAVVSYQTILYCGQAEEVVMDFLAFDTGRLEVEAEWVATSCSLRPQPRWSKFGRADASLNLSQNLRLRVELMGKVRQVPVL